MITPVAARYPSSAKDGKATCFDTQGVLGLAQNASISVSLVHADAGYATEAGPTELFLETTWVARGQSNAHLRTLASKDGDQKLSPTLKFENFYTLEMPSVIATSYTLNDSLREQLDIQSFEDAQLKVDVVQKLSRGASETLGSLYLSGETLKKHLSRHKTGFVVSESLPLKYRGLASIETSIYCSASRR